MDVYLVRTLVWRYQMLALFFGAFQMLAHSFVSDQMRIYALQIQSVLPRNEVREFELATCCTSKMMLRVLLRARGLQHEQLCGQHHSIYTCCNRKVRTPDLYRELNTEVRHTLSSTCITHLIQL